jgi:Flp pilus assembly protein TadB
MPYVNTFAMLKTAQQHQYAIGAFNAENMEMVQAIVAAAELMHAPVIIQLNNASILMKPEEFLGLSIICAIGSFALIIMLTRLPVAAVLISAVGFLIPEIILDRKKRKRMSMLNSQLPEALSII